LSQWEGPTFVADTFPAMPRGAPRLRTPDGKMNQIGERLKARRLELGLTQAQLSAQLEAVTEGRWNPTPQEVLRIEAGTRACLDLEVTALATALRTSSCWLFSGE
jgi:hypothetical protein